MGPKRQKVLEEGQGSRSRGRVTRSSSQAQGRGATPQAQQAQASGSRRRRQSPIVEEDNEPQRQVREIPKHHLDNIYNIDFLNQEQMNKYDIMFERGIDSTRFLDVDLMDRLCLSTDMKWLYERLGLLDWWNAWYKTYPKLVLEFFSSVLIYNPQWMEVEDCMLNFQCNGKEYTMQAVDFYKIYGFRDGGLRKRDNDIRSESFWPRISDEPIYKSSSSKCSSIRNPVFRCFQRAIANTFLARGDSQNVMRNDELYFLWACFELDEPIDIGYHFLSQLSSIASKKLGKIKIGGMLTPLFTHLKVDLGREEVADGPSVLDLDIFVASGLFRKKGDVVYLANPFLRLPCDRRIRITDENNWKVGPASDGEDDEEEEAEEENEGEDNQEQVEEANQEDGEGDNEVPFDMRSLQYSIRNIGNDTQRILRELGRQNQMIQQIGVRQTRVENRVDSIYHHFYPPPPPPQE